jgi:glycosyltransferase involved in cell wall biosynthesis
MLGAMRHPKLISVVVPLLDKAEHLPAQLEALAAQDYDGRWEVIVADNGSRDGSVAVAERGVASLPGGRVVHAGAIRSCGHARNAGAAEARGDFLAFCDADDVVSRSWLTELAEAAADADLVAGGVDKDRLNDPVPRSWHRQPPRHLALYSLRFLAFASGTSTGVWTETFRELGGYEERWPAGEDMDFSWRAQLAGHRLAVTDRAVVHQRLRGDIRSLARQQFSYGLAGPVLHRRFARDGMPPVLARETLGTCARILATAPLAAFSARARGRWTLAASLLAGQVVGSVRSPASFAY